MPASAPLNGKVRHCSTKVDHDQLEQNTRRRDESGRMMVDKKSADGGSPAVVLAASYSLMTVELATILARGLRAIPCTCNP